MARVALIRYHDIGSLNTRLPESLNRRQGVVPPLGIAYIASHLRSKGHQVQLIDAIASRLTPQQLRSQLRQFQAEVAGVTAMTQSLRGALEAARIAKEEGCMVVMGGSHMAAYPEETLSYDFIDYGIYGEGEMPMEQLVSALEEEKPLDSIKGLIFRRDHRVEVNEPSIVEDLDQLPFPARDLLPNQQYSSIIGLHPITTMITTRGCPYRCAFCFKQPSDIKFRMRKAASVVDEMEEAVRMLKVKEVMFYDDCLTLRKEHVLALCDEILRRGLRVAWESPARVDKVDREMLTLMKRAGCRMLRFGIESGDEEILKAMRKGITFSQVHEAFKMAQEAGISTFAYFMVGYLGERFESFQETVNLAMALNPDLCMFTLTIPYPRTPLYEEVRQKGLITEDYWRLVTLGKVDAPMPYLNPEAVEWVKKAYSSFYFRPSYVLKRFFKIRSWQDVLKCFEALKGLLLFRMH